MNGSFYKIEKFFRFVEIGFNQGRDCYSMIISYSKKFVFVKTRKTAGSTFKKLLYPYLDPKKGYMHWF